MTGIKGHDYTWSNSWIEFKAPNAQGVYCLLDKEGNVLFIGKGNIRGWRIRRALCDVCGPPFATLTDVATSLM